MVQLMGSLQSEIIEDFAEEEYASLSKRSRTEAVPLNQLNSGNIGGAIPPPMYNPLDEPSPLGLKLRKSPSLLDLIQMRLSHGNSASAPVSSCEVSDSGRKKDGKANAASNANDKLKASNFPASILRIGTWEYVSQYEGDLVAKCYFAKHKIVWEVLEGGLKSKIEIQWSDITALKADLPDNAPGSLTILLSRKPVFFRETNPQPRKHTLWQAGSDFTDGQASVNLKHYIECLPGVLNKHYEKLLQCDIRLYHLSLQPELVMNSPNLESQASVPENSEVSKGEKSCQMSSAKGSPLSVCQDTASSEGTQVLSSKSGQSPLPSEHVSKESSLPCLVMDTQAIESSKANDEQNSGEENSAQSSEVPGLRPSMSMNDFVNHLESCLSAQKNSGSLPSEKAEECEVMLESISQVLLSDTPFATDERSLMKKVNSLCSILHEPAISSSAQVNDDSIFELFPSNHGKSIWLDFAEDIGHDQASSFTQAPEGNFKDRQECKQPPSMSRKDSFSDLLLHLPRIASLPKFPKLFGIAEDDEKKGK